MDSNNLLAVYAAQSLSALAYIHNLGALTHLIIMSQKQYIDKTKLNVVVVILHRLVQELVLLFVKSN